MAEPVAILGAGMAGLGAAHRLHADGRASTLYEKQPYYGGHATSFSVDGGFVFDEGGHISFTKDTRLQGLFAANVGNEYETLHASVNNYWRGHWIKHPAQCNLHGLPTDLVVDSVRDFVEVGAEPHEIRHYGDWLVASYGRTFAEKFPMEYTLKYHTTTADNMSTDWLGSRMYRPTIEEVVRGALAPSTPDVHYVSNFRYPSRGGFMAYLTPFTRLTDLRLEHELVALDPAAREMRFASGAVARYEQLISSIPLPELIRLIPSAPQDVRAAARRLACTSLVLVTVGVDREDVSDAHWTYFYDRDMFFTRLNFPSKFSPGNAPAGTSTIQADVYFSDKYRPLDRRPEDCLQPVLDDLRRCGLLLDEDHILFTHTAFVPYANVIFDLERSDAVAAVHHYLDEVAVLYCGRYGEWGYLWTDESFVSGEKAAQRALDQASPAPQSG